METKIPVSILFSLISSLLTLGLRPELLGSDAINRALRFTRAAQEGTSAGFRRVRVSVCARISLSASADLLSSVFAFFDRLAC